MLFFKSLYADLVMYMLLLCVFMPVWVFILLGWQVLSSPIISCQEDESITLELIWTIMPSVLVLALCLLNCQCLGGTFSRASPFMMKAIGHQWYWSYESSLGGVYDSVMVSFLSSVDKPLCLCLYKSYYVLVGSADVIHSFVLPVFNIKVDAIPGRIKQVSFFPDRLGVFVGYCSELCGAGHAYMPIVAEVVMGKYKC